MSCHSIGCNEDGWAGWRTVTWWSSKLLRLFTAKTNYFQFDHRSLFKYHSTSPKVGTAKTLARNLGWIPYWLSVLLVAKLSVRLFSPSVSRRSRGRAFARQLKLDSSIFMAYPSTEHLAFRCTRSKKFSFSLIDETQPALSLSPPSFHLLHGLIMNCIIKSEKKFFRSKNKMKERMSAWKCGSCVKSVREEQTDRKATSIRPCSTTC